MPQLENGYTRIADEILEKVAKTKLNGTQLRILLIVWRCTYGWQKKEHELSLGYLSNATDIHKQQIKREIDSMIEQGILEVSKEATFNTGRIIGFNKNYIQSSKELTVSEKAYPTVSELVYPTVSELAYQNKDINKHNKYKDVYDYYLTKDLIKHRQYTKDMTDAMKRVERQLGLDTDYMKRIIDRHEQKVLNTAKSEYKTKVRPLAELFGQKKYNSTSLICVDYLDENYQEQPKQTSDWRQPIVWGNK